MKRNFKSICIVLSLVFVLILILSYPDVTIDSVLMGINIWMYNVFPALFPFFILSDLLVNYGFVEIISKLFKNLMKLFGLSANSSYVLFASIITGSPSGAKITKQLLEEGLITLDDANHLIKFTHFSNPLFVVGMVGNILLGDIGFGYLIWFGIILGNIIIGITFKRKRCTEEIENNFEYKKRNTIKDNFNSILSNSISNSFDTLFLLLGIIIIFLIISNIISNLNVNENFLIIIKGLLEMTQGVKLVSVSDFCILIKLILITIFLSFGGLSIHLQVSSIISETKIKYKNFFVFRIIHSIISSILVFILSYLFW